MGTLKEFFMELVLPFISVLLFATVFFGLLIHTGVKVSCTAYQEQTGRETSYKTLGGCFVKSGDTWLTLDEYTATITASAVSEDKK